MGTESNAPRRLTRRTLLGGASLGGLTLLLAACGAATTPTAGSGAGGGATSVPATGGGGAPTSAPTAAATSAASARPATTAVSSPAIASPASSAGAGTFPSPTVLKASGVTLEVWGGVPAENGPADLVAVFQKAYPEITVNYTRYVNDDTGNTKLDTALQGGTPIDVYFSYDFPRMAQRIKAGVAEDLTPYVNADPAVKAWATETEGIFKYQDKFQSLPTTTEPNFMFVNKKLADAAGVKFPAQWMIDDFRAVAKQLSTKDVYGTYGPPDITQMVLGPNRWYKADGTSNFDNPVYKQYLELYRGMIAEKSAFPWSEVLAQNLRAYAQNPFLSGQVATWISSTFSLRYVNDKEKYPHDFVTSFVAKPNPPGVAKPYNGGGINNWIMMQPKTKNKDAAWAFLRYWLSDGAQYMLKGGKIPAFPGTSIDAIVAGILGPNRDTLYDVESFRRIIADPSIRYITDTESKGAAEIQKIVQEQTDRCLINEITPEQWVTTVKAQADEAIKKAG